VRALALTLAAARRNDVLWLFTQHPAPLLGAWLGRRLFGTPFIVDTGDLLAESERTAGSSSVWVRLVGAWERLSVRLPDAVVVRGTAHLAVLREVAGRDGVLIPDGVECDEFARRDGRAVRQALGMGDAVTLGVVATVSWEPRLGLPSPGWDVVECVSRLKDLDVAGIVIGDGPGLPRLVAMAERLGVRDRLKLPGRVPLAAIPDYLSAMDIFLHTALNNPMSAVRTTGKLPLLLASGCAAVVSRVGEAARVLEGTGMLLDFDGPPDEYAKRVAERVRAIVTNGELARWREAGPVIARREFDYARLARRAEELVRRLTPRRAAPA
jgi:glycosyltransferase involved in cell wall biosynthesis